MNIQTVDIWNYLANTKELIGKSNALVDALPPNSTTVEPPEKLEGKRIYFDEVNNKWFPSLVSDTTDPTILTVYCYTPDTHLFIGASDAMSDSLPENCTIVAPTETPAAGHILVWNGTQWITLEDHVGETVYSTITAEPEQISTPGRYPQNTTPLAPDVPYPVWNGNEWITDTAAQESANIKANISEYKRRMSATMLALCPLNATTILTSDEEQARDALEQYALALADFIKSVNLADGSIIFPEPVAGLLNYPYGVNPTFKE